MCRFVTFCALFLLPGWVAAHGLDEPRHLVELTPTTGTRALTTDYGLVVERPDGLELFADEAFAGRVYAYAIFGEPERWFAATSQGMFVSADEGCSWSRDPAFSALATDLEVAEGSLWAVSDVPGVENVLMRWDPSEKVFSPTEHTSTAQMSRLTRTGDDQLWMQVGDEVWRRTDATVLSDELLGPGDFGPVLRSAVAAVEADRVVEHAGDRWLLDGTQLTVPSGDVFRAWSVGLNGDVWFGRSTDGSDFHLEWADGTREFAFADVYPTECESQVGEATREVWPTLQATGLGPQPESTDVSDEGCSSTRAPGSSPDPGSLLLLLGMFVWFRRRHMTRPSP